MIEIDDIAFFVPDRDDVDVIDPFASGGVVGCVPVEFDLPAAYFERDIARELNDREIPRLAPARWQPVGCCAIDELGKSLLVPDGVHLRGVEAQIGGREGEFHVFAEFIREEELLFEKIGIGVASGEVELVVVVEDELACDEGECPWALDGAAFDREDRLAVGGVFHRLFLPAAKQFVELERFDQAGGVDVGIPYQVCRVKWVGLFTHDERQPIRRVPTDERAADEDRVILKTAVEGLVGAVAGLGGLELDAAEPVVRKLEIGAQAQAEAPPVALIAVAGVEKAAMPEVRKNRAVGADQSRVGHEGPDLRIEVVVLEPEAGIAVDGKLGHRRAELDFVRRRFFFLRNEVCAQAFRLFRREDFFANQHVDERAAVALGAEGARSD